MVTLTWTCDDTNCIFSIVQCTVSNTVTMEGILKGLTMGDTHTRLATIENVVEMLDSKGWPRDAQVDDTFFVLYDCVLTQCCPD
jgi:hypothetical protein